MKIDTDTIHSATRHVIEVAKQITGHTVDYDRALESVRIGAMHFGSEDDVQAFALDIWTREDDPRPHWVISLDGIPELNERWETVASLCAASVEESCPKVSLERLSLRARQHLLACHKSCDLELMELAPDFILSALLIEYGQ